MIAHNVYFTLKDRTEANTRALILACKTYLADHPGVVFFAAGGLAQELDRPVNVRDWDVALHVVFDTMANHDLYQVAPMHLQFIEENKPSWEKVQVFDSVVEGA